MTIVKAFLNRTELSGRTFEQFEAIFLRVFTSTMKLTESHQSADGPNSTEIKIPYFKQNITNRFLMISWWARNDITWYENITWPWYHVEVPNLLEMMGLSYLNGHWWRFPLGACREGRPKRPFRRVPSLHPKDSRTNGLHDLIPALTKI